MLYSPHNNCIIRESQRGKRLRSRGVVGGRKIDGVVHSTGKLTTAMAGTADAAKNALNSIFDKTKDVLSTAAETTKGYASQASQALGKIIPSASHDHEQVPSGGPPTPPAVNPIAAPPPPTQQ
ncbi:hypothetical protein KIN20_034495 [Parelaphostrongylus tenuis]|uniref:Uncharacterized protein n=1 Tax=Parelaphostrongylus tenuis TaxID=148309 RepID=A0AAD5R9S1_PARTN|nr:hypothetical protein KIN20_034495 [Parelaphostrongylus tenuis]